MRLDFANLNEYVPMMSLEAIVALNEEIAARAAQKLLVPFVPGCVAAIDQYPPFPFPNLGCHVPRGWERTGDSWFVDKTGHGYDWEPALSIDQFKDTLRSHVEMNPEHGFAISEEGPFQVVISAFARRRKKKQ